MNCYKKTGIFLVVSVSFYAVSLQSVVVGSNTAVSRQAVTTFPAIDTNNTMQGFASFENGFTLQNAATTCTFDSLLPVSGPINLNFGRLFLLRDLKLSDTAYIMTMGNIFGNSRNFTLAQSTTALTVSLNRTYTLQAVNLELSNNLTLSVHLSFNNTSMISGNGFAIDFAQTGSISVGMGGSLLLKNVTLKNLSASRLACWDTSATITLNNVKILLDNHYAFTVGRLDFLGDVFVDGLYTFSYQSGSVSTIQSRSMLTLGQQTKLRYQPATTIRNGITFKDGTSSLFLNGATLSSSSTGLQLTKGTMIIDGKVTFASDAVSTAEGITWGDGASADNDLTVLVMPAGRIDVTSGHLVNKNLS